MSIPTTSRQNEQKNAFGGRFTGVKDKLQSDIYDAAHSINGGNVLIAYDRLEAIIARHIKETKQGGKIMGTTPNEQMDELDRILENHLKGIFDVLKAQATYGQTDEWLAEQLANEHRVAKVGLAQHTKEAVEARWRGKLIPFETIKGVNYVRLDWLTNELAAPQQSTSPDEGRKEGV